MNNKLYFASSNSMMGFQSYFNEIYDPKKLSRIYIIKGGPGTGKSTTIKKIGEIFEKEHNCEYFLCSSDPKSVDGILIDDEIAIVDGTSPHVTEARYPGAVEIIIDNAYGISSGIRKHKKEIIELNQEKSKYYKYAYTYLQAAGEIKKEHISRLYNILDVTKLESAIDRYFKQNYKIGENYTEKIRLTQAITPFGIFRANSFEYNSKKKSIIINGKGYEEIIFNAIIRKAHEYKLGIKVSYDPLIAYSPDALFITDESTAIVSYDKTIHGEIDYDKYKVLNFERFIKKNNYSEIKLKLKFAEKCIESLTNEAVINLSSASKIHKRLEEIYTEYTDFSVIDQNIQRIIKEISFIL